MYSVQHFAARVGVTPRQARKFLRATGVQATGGRYEFTRDDLDRLEVAYRRVVPVAIIEDEDPTPPGLAISMLRDRENRAVFAKLRRDRLRRLELQMREAGVSLAQLSDDALVETGRALSMGDR